MAIIIRDEWNNSISNIISMDSLKTSRIYL